MSSPKANHEDRDLIAPGAANDAVVGGETPDRETAGEPEEFAAEILVSDDEAEHLPDDPRPDVLLDDVLAEYGGGAGAELFTGHVPPDVVIDDRLLADWEAQAEAERALIATFGAVLVTYVDRDLRGAIDRIVAQASAARRRLLREGRHR